MFFVNSKSLLGPLLLKLKNSDHFALYDNYTFALKKRTLINYVFNLNF